MMRPRIMRAAIPLAVFLLAALPVRAQRLGTPGPEDAPQLVTPGPDPVIRIPVAHDHFASNCFGYLYFSKKTMRYEVLHPEWDKDHSFEERIPDLTVARQWTLMGSPQPYAEFKFSDGRTYHFVRLKRKIAEGTKDEFAEDDLLPWELLVDAATTFDTVLAQVQMANAQAAAAATPAAPAVDDSTVMDSAGLEVPPPPPWARPAASAGSGRS